MYTGLVLNRGMTNTERSTWEHLDGEPCQSGPDRHDDALCAEHGRLVRLAGAPDGRRPAEFVAICPDAVQRHEGTFPTQLAAQHWAEKGHACLAAAGRTEWRHRIIPAEVVAAWLAPRDPEPSHYDRSMNELDAGW